MTRSGSRPPGERPKRVRAGREKRTGRGKARVYRVYQRRPRGTSESWQYKPLEALRGAGSGRKETPGHSGGVERATRFEPATSSLGIRPWSLRQNRTTADEGLAIRLATSGVVLRCRRCRFRTFFGLYPPAM